MGTLSFAQQFTGKIIDKETKKGIPNAKIEFKELNLILMTDQDGRFNWTNKSESNLQCQITAKNYKDKALILVCCDQVQIELESDPHEMNEMHVTAKILELDDNISHKTDYISMDKLSILSTQNLTEALSLLEGVQTASYGPLNAKPVIRGMQGMRVVTLWEGMRIENQQWGSDHGLGISQVGIGSAEVIKGPMSLIYQGDAVGGMIYLKEAPFAPLNSVCAEISSQFESTSLGTQNSFLVKLSKNKFRMNMAGIYSSAADYKLPNGKYLSDSRMQDVGFKSNIGYNIKKVSLKLNYLYSNSIIGIPGHTHDSVATPSSFMTTVQNRSRSLPHQWIKNHFLNIKTTHFISSKHKLEYMVNFSNNALSEYEEKIFTPAIDMNLYVFKSQIRHRWQLNNSLEILSGIMGSRQLNINTERADEIILVDSKQDDFGGFSSLNSMFGSWNYNVVIRADYRAIKTSSFEGDYLNMNGGMGLRRQWKERYLHDFALNISSGSRAPHTSELLSNGVHHGSSRYEIGDTSLRSEYFTQLDLNYDFSNEHFSFLFNPFISYTQNYIQIAPRGYSIDNMQVYQYESIQKGVLYGLETRMHYHPHFMHFVHLESGFSSTVGHNLEGDFFFWDYFYFMPQSRLRTNIRFDLTKSNKLGFKSLLIQHQYFFNQNRTGIIETPTRAYHYIQVGCNMQINLKNPIELSFGVRNLFNTEFVNHLSRLKPLGLTEPGRSFYINLKWMASSKLK